MSRYIDADALVELIDHYILHDKDAKKNHSALFIEGMKDGYYRIRSNIISLPSADVVEVVHGKWVDKGEDYVLRWYCSNCGRKDTHIYNFCPDCGADMRGGTDDTQT